MARKFPVDFEQKVKQPPPIDGRGYPYQLSAKDLMRNFQFTADLLPEGKKGDMLYNDGSNWVLLDNPGEPTTGEENALIHDGSIPAWNARASAGTGADQPWKVTANGDGTVTVSAGHLFYRTSESPAADTLPQWYHLKVFASYAGGSVTVGGSGRIYASIAVNPSAADYAALTNIYGADPFYLNRVYPSGSISVEYGTMPTTGDVFIVEIAAVSLVDGVAVVDTQFLTHNPVVGDYSLTGPVGP